MKRSGCLIGIVAAVLMFSLLIMAGSWWLLQQVRERAGRLTPTPVIPRATAVRVTPGPHPPIVLVDPDMEQLGQTWAGAPAGGILQVTMSEDKLEQELLAGLAGAPAQGFELENVQLLPGLVRLTGRTQMNGLEVQIAGTASVTAADCWLDIRLTQMQFGRLPAPGFVTQQFQDLIDGWNNTYRQDPPMCVSDVTITQGQITLVGIKR